MNNFYSNKPKYCFMVAFLYSTFFAISIPLASIETSLEIASAPNPVAPGARSLGAGGTSITLSDDATSAYFNPAQLIRLLKKEFSIGFCKMRRKEQLLSGKYPGSMDAHHVSARNINFASVTYPFSLYNRNMVVSLSYQELYDFNRDWKLNLYDNMNIDYLQYGQLTALAMAYCIQIKESISFGITLNYFDNDITNNQWNQKYNLSIQMSDTWLRNYSKEEVYTFKGWNANIGLLWRMKNLTFGAIIKTPFVANIKHDIHISEMDSDNNTITPKESYEERKEKLEMPMSYGIGISYKYSHQFIVAVDFYRTQWDNFIYRDEKGNENSPINGKSASLSNTNPTHQVRMGCEYRFIDRKNKRIIPVRAGVFYDPAPSTGCPDNIYGVSFGFGLTQKLFSFDIAYQYRFGNNIGKDTLKHLNFSQDVKEHKLHLSFILYSY